MCCLFLQASLLDIFSAAIGDCRHSLNALQQRHDDIVAASLEQLPVVIDSLAASLDLGLGMKAVAPWLHTCHQTIVKEVKAVIAGLLRT